jgi:hypothetical protein
MPLCCQVHDFTQKNARHAGKEEGYLFSFGDPYAFDMNGYKNAWHKH